jgi:hypothetical protein
MSRSQAAAQYLPQPIPSGPPGTELLQDFLASRAAYASDEEHRVLRDFIRVLHSDHPSQEAIGRLTSYLTQLRAELTPGDWLLLAPQIAALNQ